MSSKDVCAWCQVYQDILLYGLTARPGASTHAGNTRTSAELRLRRMPRRPVHKCIGQRPSLGSLPLIMEYALDYLG
jgi:hypothetical protein